MSDFNFLCYMGIKWKTRLLLFFIEEEKIPHPVHQWNAFTISPTLFWLPFPEEVKLLCLSTPERRALQTGGKTARLGSTACRGGAALSSRSSGPFAEAYLAGITEGQFLTAR